MSDTHGETLFVRLRWLEATFREGVRKRPSMFVGDVGVRGLHHIVDDILTNSLIGGFARTIAVVLKKDGSICITVDGRGFSVPLQECLTTPPSPDFRRGNPGQRDIVWRIWAFAVANALSERFRIEADIDGRVFEQEYRAGAPCLPATEVEGDCRSGISVTFLPDPDIFSDTKFSSAALRNRLEELAFLHSGVSITFEDESAETSDKLQFDDGIRTFVEKLNRDRTPLHEIAVIRGEEVGIHFEVGIQFCKERTEVIRAYVNDRYCPDRGTHVTGVRIGLTRSIKRIAEAKWSTKDNGLTAVVSVYMENPQLMGACRSSLGNSEVRTVLASQVGKQMTDFLVANPDGTAAIIQGGNARSTP